MVELKCEAVKEDRKYNWTKEFQDEQDAVNFKNWLVLIGYSILDCSTSNLN